MHVSALFVAEYHMRDSELCTTLIRPFSLRHEARPPGANSPNMDERWDRRLLGSRAEARFGTWSPPRPSNTQGSRHRAISSLRGVDNLASVELLE